MIIAKDKRKGRLLSLSPLSSDAHRFVTLLKDKSKRLKDKSKRLKDKSKRLKDKSKMLKTKKKATRRSLSLLI
ncbi:hypothetical protein VN24_08505 [Paenibacillus beijingensis]|uniref:Uncharacterized protein n=1 Tax=Paenibacillus beijingensis TaxID=1126833 RepID=A0A0D5NHN7_9BACL|nr:hypothetical protein VN24_08505 [Paenibacillus beijingensis]